MRAIGHLGTLGELAARDTPAARLDARTKVLATLAFVAVVASFGRHDLLRLAPLALFPLALAALGDVPLRALVRPLLLASPFALGVAAFEPLLDRAPVAVVVGVAVSGGALGFATILAKFALSLSAALLLVATTGFDQVCVALRRLGTPRALVAQLLLTHRYLFVLSGEAARSLRAHALRAPGRARPTLRVAGSMLGALLVRAMGRAERVHAAMQCRGFAGELPIVRRGRPGRRDAAFAAATVALLLAARTLDLPARIGAALAGGVR
jgi:cobalt/nickel transport system permease protein